MIELYDKKIRKAKRNCIQIQDAINLLSDLKIEYNKLNKCHLLVSL